VIRSKKIRAAITRLLAGSVTPGSAATVPRRAWQLSLVVGPIVVGNFQSIRNGPANNEQIDEISERRGLGGRPGLQYLRCPLRVSAVWIATRV
jgi:hypothetical protein